MNYKLNKKEIKEILAGKNLEQYVFDTNIFKAYFATAFASHDLLYKLIQLGSIEQKINVIEHGSSRHIKIMLNDYSSIIRNRAIRKAIELESNIYHEYVTSEKFKMLFNKNTSNEAMFFFQRENNSFLKEIYDFSINKNEINSLLLYKIFTDKVLAKIKLSKLESIQKRGKSNKEIDLQEIAKTSKKLIYKHGFTYELLCSYNIGTLAIFRGEDNISSGVIDYGYYNETNPLLFIYIWEIIVSKIVSALSVYDISLDKFHFDTLESFQDYKDNRLIMKKLGFTKEELLDILKLNNSLLGEKNA